ncbi:hypothetical protein [Streptomyces sp. NPDC057545]|uniref:hypothetical protein n=1 Tax=Streptomyces sp. NPDC057545 TaxID=3346164 RepID=UPI0036B5BAB8
MAVISDELHCDAVRVSGRDPERLSIAAHCAAAAGLEVWFAPFPVDLPSDRLLLFFADCARRAEAVRENGAEVVFGAGCEMSAFCGGFIPGDTYGDRLRTMAEAGLEWWHGLGLVQERLNAFLMRVAETARAHFGGRITYASAPWEFVDWRPFDLVGVDAYRAAYNADTFRSELRGHLAHGKPVAVTEYGTCAYRGAGERGGAAWQVPHGAVPDEDEQVRYAGPERRISAPTAWSACSMRHGGHRRRCSTRWQPGTAAAEGKDTRRRLRQQSCEANLSPTRGVRVGDRAFDRLQKTFVF